MAVAERGAVRCTVGHSASVARGRLRGVHAWWVLWAGLRDMLPEEAEAALRAMCVEAADTHIELASAARLWAAEVSWAGEEICAAEPVLPTFLN